MGLDQGRSVALPLSCLSPNGGRHGEAVRASLVTLAPDTDHHTMSATHCIAADGSERMDSPTLIALFLTEKEAERAYEDGKLDEYKNPRPMTLDEYREMNRSHWLDDAGDLLVVDQSTYKDKLEVLPPQDWTCGASFGRFNMQERLSSSITRQYARLGGNGGEDTLYVHRTVDMADKDTWITPEEIRTFRENTRTTDDGQPGTDIRTGRTIVRHVGGTVAVIAERHEHKRDFADLWLCYAFSGYTLSLGEGESVADFVDESDMRYWGTGDIRIIGTLEDHYTRA